MSRMKPRTRVIGRLLVVYRSMNQIGVRELAKQIGTSSATLSRIERGHEMDATTLMRIWAWLLSEPRP